MKWFKSKKGSSQCLWLKALLCFECCSTDKSEMDKFDILGELSFKCDTLMYLPIFTNHAAHFFNSASTSILCLCMLSNFKIQFYPWMYLKNCNSFVFCILQTKTGINEGNVPKWSWSISILTWSSYQRNQPQCRSILWSFSMVIIFLNGSVFLHWSTVNFGQFRLRNFSQISNKSCIFLN